MPRESLYVDGRRITFHTGKKFGQVTVHNPRTAINKDGTERRHSTTGQLMANKWREKYPNMSYKEFLTTVVKGNGEDFKGGKGVKGVAPVKERKKPTKEKMAGCADRVPARAPKQKQPGTTKPVGDVTTDKRKFKGAVLRALNNKYLSNRKANIQEFNQSLKNYGEKINYSSSPEAEADRLYGVFFKSASVM